MATQSAALSDEQLSATRLEIDDPLAMPRLSVEKPCADLEPQIVGEYHLGKDQPRLWCCHCQGHRHHNGFVITNSGGANYLIGSKCGPDHYGLSFKFAEREHKAKVKRKGVLDRLKGICATAEALKATPSFNTTTSMGRLTLNMLLSFAQFEREVTAERIRDKIAASKAKGMWMGGTCPIGYRPEGRSLAIVEEDAALVRRIFARYLELGKIRLLYNELLSDGVLKPVRLSTTGRAHGGAPFNRSELYNLISNRVYVGDIVHKERHWPGLHSAIIDSETFERAQALIRRHVKGDRSPENAAERSLLPGRVFSDAAMRSWQPIPARRPPAATAATATTFRSTCTSASVAVVVCESPHSNSSK